MLNDLFVWMGLDGGRRVLAALLLPPVPFIVLTLVGARVLFTRRWLGWLMVLAGAAGSWLACTEFAADTLRRTLQPPVHALARTEIDALKRAPRTAIVVLGGGTRPLAPEYGMADLLPRALDRLRYGMWLARETALPVLFSGGRGHGAEPGATEAEVAARVAERDFRQPLRWTETESRDTRENALRSVALLRAQGIEHIVLVTEAYHMPRSLRNFERAAAGAGGPMRITAAPMALPVDGPLELIDFVPTRRGFESVHLLLHETLGRAIGA